MDFLEVRLFRYLVELQPGVRVFGKLPSNIKRPVKDGVVIARQQPMPMTNAREFGMRQLMWGEWTTIAEDGSFEFLSMPRSGKGAPSFETCPPVPSSLFWSRKEGLRAPNKVSPCQKIPRSDKPKRQSDLLRKYLLLSRKLKRHDAGVPASAGLCR